MPAVKEGATLQELQRNAALPALENRILLAHALGLSRVQLITHSERRLTFEEAQRFDALLQRRLHGEPIAYIVGRREFFGLELHVSSEVLIPRPETELLVELALDRLAPDARVLDMGTGSGAIAVAIAHARADAKVAAIDVSSAALAVARSNAALHGAQVEFLQSDWYAALAGRLFELIVSNPPYIVAGDPHLARGDLRFEPMSALTDRADGLSALRTIVAGAPQHLTDGAWLLMEHGYDQAAAVAGMLVEKGFVEVQSWRDLAGVERVTGGRLSA